MVDEQKSKSVGVVFNSGRVKKRPTKLAKVASKIPWARLISQYSQVRFFVFVIYDLFGRLCKDWKQDWRISVNMLNILIRLFIV